MSEANMSLMQGWDREELMNVIDIGQLSFTFLNIRNKFYSF